MRELRERAEQIVRILCLVLAGIVVYQLAGIAIRWNPFRGVTVPELPTLTAATNNPPPGTHGAGLAMNGRGQLTNTASQTSPTNSAHLTKAETNLPSQRALAAMGTNAGTVSKNLSTNALLTATGTTPETNALPFETNTSPTNSIAVTPSTNHGTNLLLAVATTDTNASALKPKRHKSAAMSAPEMMGMGFNPFGPAAKPVDLPPALQSRVNKITDSEILGPVIHPLPMALLGIAGQFAFLRSANGQTGLIKEGDTLDDIKLLRIGINRVLIEQDGQKKELMIFSGYGGDSLLPKDSSNENNHP